MQIHRGKFWTVPHAFQRIYRRFAAPRSNPRKVEFELDSAIAWLSALRDSGAVFGFPEDLDSKAGTKPFVILTHDIHHDLDRTVAMAQAEHEKGIAGIYFTMGPHGPNRKIFGSRRSWKQLRTIQGMGHRLGLHLDVIDAILRRGDLYAEIEDIVARFSAEGLVLRYGNSHSNSVSKALGVRGSDFFAETSFGKRTSETGEVSSTKLNEHLDRYSLKHIGERFGLQHWVDFRVFRDGVRLPSTLYVSDKSGAIQIPARGIESNRFAFDAAFVKASISALADAGGVVSLHPQWYAPTPRVRAKPALIGILSPKAGGPRETEDSAPAESKKHFDPQIFNDLQAVELTADRDILDLSILKDGFRYDCRLNRRETASHLIVALHGGVGDAKALPVLARWTQDFYFRAPILSPFDPLIYEHPHIRVGWFVGDLARDATAGLADIVRRIAGRLDIPADRVVFVGSSSGGFAAIRLACALGGGKFISINGLRRIADYHQKNVRPFSAAFDPVHTPDENAAIHESRWATPPALEQALQSGEPVRGVIIQNINDGHHFEKHYKPFCAQFGLPVEGGYSSDKRLRSVPYEGETAHGPEPAKIARRMIKEFIPEMLG